MSSQWAGSGRRAELPHNWPSLRARTFHRDSGQCTWLTDNVRCPEKATDCDHIGDKTDHTLDNLRSLCRWHHAKRTAEQGNAARTKLQPRQRPPRPHPGLTDH